MNSKIVKSLALAAVTAFSASSLAFAPPKVRIETKALEIPTAPKTTTGKGPAVGSEIKVGNTLNLRSDIVVGEKANKKGQTCDVKHFAVSAENISVSGDTLADLNKRGVMDTENDDCGKAFAEMGRDAREVAAETAVCSVGKGIENVSDINQRAEIGGECMKMVKDAHHIPTTLLQAKESWMAVRNKCRYVL